jgi:hypothetical protein
MTIGPAQGSLGGCASRRLSFEVHRNLEGGPILRGIRKEQEPATPAPELAIASHTADHPIGRLPINSR